MYKRRVDLLEPLLAELNPTYYLMVIRQLQYELAEIYSDIAQCKVEVSLWREREGMEGMLVRVEVGVSLVSGRRC